MKRIAIFASGSGTNAQNIIEYFATSLDVHVALILSNKQDAYVLKRAEMFAIPTFVFSSKELKETMIVLSKLKEHKIDFIVLAGFMIMVPKSILHSYPDKIVNIHPALLPKYGGKGMYGDHVHKAVIDAGERESGITVHFVNEQYDEGQIIFQASCEVLPNDNPESLAKRIHQLEYEHYPRVIEEVLTS